MLSGKPDKLEAYPTLNQHPAITGRSTWRDLRRIDGISLWREIRTLCFARPTDHFQHYKSRRAFQGDNRLEIWNRVRPRDATIPLEEFLNVTHYWVTCCGTLFQMAAVGNGEFRTLLLTQR